MVFGICGFVGVRSTRYKYKYCNFKDLSNNMGRDQRRDWTAVFVLVLLSIRPIVCNSLVPISCPYRSYSFLRTKGNSNDDHRPNEGPSEQPVSGFESLVRQVTGRSEYRFGDLTKNAVEDLAKATHLVDDDYHFGVSTHNVVYWFLNILSNT